MCSSSELKYETWLCFFPQEAIKIGVNCCFFKYGGFTDWKGLDQALLRGKMTQSMAGLITIKLWSQEHCVLQDLVALQVGSTCGKYERWQLDSKFMQLRSFFVLCLNSIWLSGILVCDWAHHTNKWTVFFLALKEQACVCAAYILWADSDPASHCHIQDHFRSEQGFNHLLPSCFWWLCVLMPRDKGASWQRSSSTASQNLF